MSSLPNLIFDLDGTLVDSAPSLCKAGNFLLSKLGRPQIAVETYKNFIGKGLLKQVEQLLTFTGGVPDNNLDEQTKIMFSGVKLNRHLPASLFNFKVPHGVDLLTDK